jgi:hypothetical protein
MRRLLSIAVTSAVLAAATGALAQEGPTYRIQITNLTPGQSFTPQLVIAHRATYRMFHAGEPASEALAVLAEGGDTNPLTDDAEPFAHDIQTIPGLLGPGQTASTTFNARPGALVSVAAMLIPTNDTFFALNAEPLPASGTAKFMVPAYDAGSEANDQNCRNIPGPRCGGEGVSAPAESDEGFVHIGNGFHATDLVDDVFDVLGPAVYDWRNPVARITIRRVDP